MSKLNVFLVILLLGACQETDSIGTEYCSKQILGSNLDKLVFDIESNRIIGSDTSSEYTIMESTFAVGIVRPIPISLPKNTDKLYSGPIYWKLGDFTFVAAPISILEPKTTIIQALPNKMLEQASEELTSEISTVVYSAKNGIVQIGFNGGSISEPSHVIMEFCGGDKLFTFDHNQVLR